MVPRGLHAKRSLAAIRFYTPMTPSEEDAEKDRVSKLTPFQKDQELRQLNRDIARLDMLRGINTGELYTISGKYKNLARNYGVPLAVWYWTVWSATAVLCFGAVTVGGVDVMSLVDRVDGYTGWDLASKVDPTYGKIGLVIVLNELIEPVRLPVVVFTVKPMMETFFPTKY